MRDIAWPNPSADARPRAAGGGEPYPLRQAGGVRPDTEPLDPAPALTADLLARVPSVRTRAETPL